MIMFETYENRVDRHVTIHKIGCSHLRKHGGVHSNNQGEYHEHETFQQAKVYAENTGLPLDRLFCSRCNPSDE